MENMYRCNSDNQTWFTDDRHSFILRVQRKTLREDARLSLQALQYEILLTLNFQSLILSLHLEQLDTLVFSNGL